MNASVGGDAEEAFGLTA